MIVVTLVPQNGVAYSGLTSLEPEDGALCLCGLWGPYELMPSNTVDRVLE